MLLLYIVDTSFKGVRGPPRIERSSSLDNSMKKKCSIWNYKGAGFEKNNLPSQTVPGRSMSIKEILARFTSGLLAPEDFNHSVYDYPDDDDESDDDPHFDDPMDDLLSDGSTDIAEVTSQLEASRRAVQVESQRPVSGSKSKDEPPKDDNERSEAKD